MTVDDILNEIRSIPCNDPALLPLGNMLHDYTVSLKNGEMSQEEYQELVRDLHTEQLINAQCADLHAKERLNTVCNVVINAAQLL